MPLFNINEQYTVTADTVLIYAINESNGQIVYIDVAWNELKLQQDNIYELDFGSISNQLQPGNYTIHIFGVNDVLTDLTINEISPSRYETRLVHEDPTTIPNEQNLYRNFDLRINDTFYAILSSIKDIHKDNSLIIKLFTPINSDGVVGGSNVSICTHVFDPIVIKLKVESKPATDLLYDLPDSVVRYKYVTDFLDYENTVSTSSYSSSIYSIISGLKDIEPNVDFRYWQNHVFFGSAKMVLENAKGKMMNWIDYNDQLSLMYTSGNLVELSGTYVEKKREIENTFTMYEKWVFSSSEGWPKTGSCPYHYTSSTALDWLNVQSGSASDWDNTNPAMIEYMVPLYYIESDTYGAMKSFLYMLADHFDQLKIYIKHLENMMHVSYDTYENIPDEFLWLLANLFGLNLYEGWSGKNLVQFLLGEEVSGSANTIPYKELTYDVWSRILNNLIYIYKTKGTVESLKALLNCYGIPSTLLRIREYILGSDYTGSTYEQYIEEPYVSRHLLFTSSEYVDVNYSDLKYDFTIEGRFKIEHRPPATTEVFLFGGSDGVNASGTFNVVLKSDVNASIVAECNCIINETGVCAITSGAGVPFFDGNFYSIFLNRSGSSPSKNGAISLTVIRYANLQEYLNTGSGYKLLMGTHTGTLQSSSVLQLGGNIISSESFSGACHEFKVFTMSVPSTYQSLHASNPESIVLPNPNSDYLSNTIRWKLNDTKDLNTYQWVADTSARPSVWNHGTTYGFPEYIPTYSENYNNYWGWNIDPNTRYYIPEIGPYKYSGDGSYSKVRIGSSSIIDSPKISITFAPSDVINKDIAMQVANLNFNNLLGDPGSLYSSSYQSLKPYIEAYFSKYVGAYNFYNFVKLVSQFDTGLYDTLQQLMPARVLPSYGLLIESHMLERPKFEWKKPTLSTSSLKGTASLLEYEAVGILPSVIQAYLSSSELYRNISGVVYRQIERDSDETLLLFDTTGSFELIFSNSFYDGWLNYELGTTWAQAHEIGTDSYRPGSFDWIVNRGQTRSQLRYASYIGSNMENAVQSSQSVGGPILVSTVYTQPDND